MTHQARNERQRPVLRCLLHTIAQRTAWPKCKACVLSTPIHHQGTPTKSECAFPRLQVLVKPRLGTQYVLCGTCVCACAIDSQRKPAGWSGRLPPRRTSRGACQWAWCQSCHSHRRNRTGGCLRVRERVTCCIPGIVHMTSGCGRQTPQVGCKWRGARSASSPDPHPHMHMQHEACTLMPRVSAPSLNACPESAHAM